MPEDMEVLIQTDPEGNGFYFAGSFYDAAKKRYGVCCTGWNEEGQYYHLHGKGWESTYPKEGERQACVEMGVEFYIDGVQTYYLRDFDHYADSENYGARIPYPESPDDEAFWKKLEAQLDQAAQVAYDRGLTTCGTSSVRRITIMPFDVTKMTAALRRAYDYIQAEVDDDAEGVGDVLAAISDALDPTRWTIDARIEDDAHTISIEFDARPWFDAASDEQILKLAGEGFSVGYTADEVAAYASNTNQDIQNLYWYLEKSDQGSSVWIDEDQAEAWISAKRPHLLEKIKEEEA